MTSDPPFVAPDPDNMDPPRQGSTSAARDPSQMRSPTGRQRGESIAAMGRRVDFSLGMKDVSAADFPGDVYEERERNRNRIPISVTAASRERSSTDNRGSTSRSSRDAGRSTSIQAEGESRLPQLRRVGTDSSAAASRSNHRNRFFGRRGRDDELGMAESGLADVPENEKSGGVSPEGSGNRLDPRSGRVSPTAMRFSMEGPSREVSPVQRISRSKTDNFEMRRV
ncbi:MAG: hypothetical protein INR71_10575 [Terriglobus roseus]|nr:hypothetical protein [Terriglobus roseus]